MKFSTSLIPYSQIVNSNNQSRDWVSYGSNGSRKKLRYANIVTSSRRKYVYDGEAVKCHCNKLAPRDTSWSDLNLRGRFYACLDLRASEEEFYFRLQLNLDDFKNFPRLRDDGCDFFKWYDGKICDRATKLLHQLCDSE
ncbi:hypothetical protein J1N35_043206 [Gossypium stocksii]|uniref:Uncharacterized protein n=1 Tax=Gossypium stocksii TaxID=47602 RepID=A0A9D3U706_9ROSI|nr:hypothetical protein J1N35_043206 [Gossypium stocksii]